MTSWKHKHILSLKNFAKADYEIILTLADKFNSLGQTGTKKIAAMEGLLVTSLFFEASTRTRNSFEIAAKRLSADVQTFSPSISSITKGESHLDTAITYSAMGSDILIIRHSLSRVPSEIANKLDKIETSTSVLNAGDGIHSHPSQGLLDLYTLSKFFSEKELTANSLDNKNILIIGDILHSRVARSDIWALTAFGANVILCGPESLIPDEFKNFVNFSQSDPYTDPVENRGTISINRSLEEIVKEADAIIVLRIQKERMENNLLESITSYRNEYCLTHELLKLNKKNIPILHPGPINRGVEIDSKIVDDYHNCLINQQVANGVPVRMSLLYLLSNLNKELTII